jgi:L-lactate dehydrogenase
LPQSSAHGHHQPEATEARYLQISGALAQGEAMELAHGASYYPAAAVRSATDVEMLATDAIVISAGRCSKPGESRLQ